MVSPWRFQVTNTLALDVNAFYDNQATFLKGIAFVLGITDMARIKVSGEGQASSGSGKQGHGGTKKPEAARSVTA